MLAEAVVPRCTSYFILGKHCFILLSQYFMDECFFSLWCGTESPEVNIRGRKRWYTKDKTLPRSQSPSVCCLEGSKPFPLSEKGWSRATQNKATAAAVTAISILLFVPITCPFYKAKPRTTVYSLSLTLRYLRAKQAAFCSWRLGWVSASQ